jgi:peptide/nickel transport system permease protein
LLTPYDPAEVNLKQRLAPPSSEHLLGTDTLGRDVFTRLLYGIRVSLFVAVGGTLIAGVIGLVLGAISGYYGGPFDQIWLRVSEIFMAFPALVLLLVLVAVMGPSLLNIIFIFAITKWATLYRLVRAQFFSLREEEFVDALRVLDIGLMSIIFRHLVPNTFGPIAVWFTLEVATGIIQEAGLSFLGLGIQPPTPSLGNLLSAAQDLRILRGHVWLWLAPGITIALITLCINFMGDWLRDVTDPRTAK